MVSSVVKNFIVRIGMLVINMGTGVVVARSLAPIGRGEQSAISLWPIMVAAFSTLGIPTALNYMTRRHPLKARRLYFISAFLSILAGLVMAPIGALVIPLLLHGYQSTTVIAAQWLMLFVPQFLLLGVIRAQLESAGEYTRSILGQLLPTVCTLVALVGLHAVDRLTPESGTLAYLLPGAVLTIWLAFRLRSRMEISFSSFVVDTKMLMSYGLRSYGTDVITALASQLDMAVIVAFLSPAALGLYTVSLSLARLLALVPQSLIVVLFPHASGLDRNDALTLVARGARLSLAVSIVAGLALALVVPFMLPLVYGRSFAQAVSIMPLLIVEQVIVGLAMVLSQAFLSTGRPGIVTVFQGAWLVCALICLLTFVPRMNVAGAAVALLAASFVRLALVLAAYPIILKRSPPRLFPNVADFAYLFAKFSRSAPITGVGTAFAE